MKKTIIIIALLIAVMASQGQSAAGKWKPVTCYTVNKSGVKDDVWKAMVKEQPCLAKEVLVLSAAGKVGVEKDHCGGTSMPFGVKYVVKGNKITIYMDDEDDEPVVFDLELKGNKMIWRHKFDEESSIRLLHYEFERA